MSLRERPRGPSLGLGDLSCNTQKVFGKLQISDERLQSFQGLIAFEIYDHQSCFSKIKMG